MKSEVNRRDRTRRAILDALAAVITETGGLGFSVQQVAERAGVTHRTVYNHFPTRDAMNDALAEHVEDVMARGGFREPPATSSASLVAMITDAYAAFQSHEVLSRAYVMLMLASRRPAGVARRRTSAFEAVIARDTSPPAPLTARDLTAALRMFLSTTGWHILTEQMGLSPAEAATTATWAAQTLLAAASRPAPVVATKTKNTRKTKTPRGSR